MINDLITWDLCLGDSSTSRYPRKQFHANDDSCIRIDQETDSPYIRFAKYIPFGNLNQKLDEEKESYDEGDATQSAYNHNKSNPLGRLGCMWLSLILDKEPSVRLPD